MPVQTRYVVIHNDVEVKTFMDKKSADEYDKMLDIADSIAQMLDKSPIKFTDEDKDQLSIYLSKERQELLIALQAKKPKPTNKESAKPTDKIKGFAEDIKKVS